MEMICKLRELMEKQDLSQKAVYEATGLPPTTIRNLYRNEWQRVDKDTVVKLMDYFKIKDLTDLFEVVQEPVK